MERIKTIPNGPKVQPTFSAAEMGQRLAKLRGHMARQGIDAVVLTSIHNIHYFSDFLYTAFGRRYALVVTPERSVTVSANIDGGQPYRRSHGENLVYTDWHRDSYFHALQQLLAGCRTIGVEFDHLNLETSKLLQDAVPDARIVDVAPALMAARMVKSAAEIEIIRDGARIADMGGAACVEAIAEGVPEYVVAQHATDVMVREIARLYPESELRDTWTWFQSGINSDGAHNPVTSRRLCRGDILSLNCFPMIAGYYTALERTLFLGAPGARALELWEINCRVHRRGLELIRPGARCCDIAAELNEIYRAHGLLERRTFGYGHSFGVLCHYYGRESGLELREDIETRLEPGMVVSMEPMIMIPEGEPGAGGYREHDILIVGTDGAEDITKFPFGPGHNIIGS